ncbi:unnamed protein product, partial [Ixodes hexagonus]
MSLWVGDRGKQGPPINYIAHWRRVQSIMRVASQGEGEGHRAGQGGLASPKKCHLPEKKNLVFAAIPMWTHKMRQTLFLHSVPLSLVWRSRLSIHTVDGFICIYLWKATS